MFAEELGKATAAKPGLCGYVEYAVDVGVACKLGKRMAHGAVQIESVVPLFEKRRFEGAELVRRGSGIPQVVVY